MFVRVEDSDGARGWGEIWCNFPNTSAEHRALLFADIVAPRALGKRALAMTHLRAARKLYGRPAGG